MSPSSDWRHQAFMAGHLSPRALAAATRRHIKENTEANIRGSSSR
ncbi:hypothetical protein ACFPZ0_01245 [Streptomonospora nanhaiensis]|nr:hypothetical protein [Streptomonospora nanhaiensis]